MLASSAAAEQSDPRLKKEGVNKLILLTFVKPCVWSFVESMRTTRIKSRNEMEANSSGGVYRSPVRPYVLAV